MAQPQNNKNGQAHSNPPISSLLVEQYPSQSILSRLHRNFSWITSKRFFDLIGGLAALFTIFMMCLVWYGAFYNGIANPKPEWVGAGYLEVGDLLFILQIELAVIAPLALLWILAKFRGWV